MNKKIFIISFSILFLMLLSFSSAYSQSSSTSDFKVETVNSPALQPIAVFGEDGSFVLPSGKQISTDFAFLPAVPSVTLISNSDLSAQAKANDYFTIIQYWAGNKGNIKLLNEKQRNFYESGNKLELYNYSLTLSNGSLNK